MLSNQWANAFKGALGERVSVRRRGYLVLRALEPICLCPRETLMALFAIIAPSDSVLLEVAIKREFPSDHFSIAPGQFAVSAPNVTTQEVAHKIGDRGEVGQFMVFPISNWWGWHRKDLWEWLTARGSA